jgi:BLOC-1-related complex sub-unit 8
MAPQPAPDALSSRLSSTLPRLLTGLAHEPSVGLHVISTHARGAAVPTLVGVRRTLDARAARLAAAAMDAQYAVDALTQHREAALPALASVRALLDDALGELDETRERAAAAPIAAQAVATATVAQDRDADTGSGGAVPSPVSWLASF